MTDKTQKPVPDESAAAPNEPDQNGDNNTPADGVPENPSVKTRFQKGRSGNPSGRPKGSRNKKTILEKILDERLKLSGGGRNRSKSKHEIAMTQIVNGTVKGDYKAWRVLLELMERHGLFEKHSQPDPSKDLTGNDDALLASFIASLGTTTEKP